MEIVSRSVAGLKAPVRQISLAPKRRNRLWLHHTVTPVTKDPKADWRYVQRVAFDRGFADISYPFGVHGPSGTCLEGRSPLVEGAHTDGYNRTSHAIVLIGNYDVGPVPQVAIDSVRWLRSEMVRLGLLTPDHLFGYHRQVSATACPGQYAWRNFHLFQAPWVAAPAPAPLPPMPTVVHTFSEDGVPMQILNVPVPTTPPGQANAGSGWVYLPIQKSRIVGIVPPGVRPGVDGFYETCEVGAAEDGDRTVLSVTGWAPGFDANVQVTVLS